MDGSWILTSSVEKKFKKNFIFMGLNEYVFSERDLIGHYKNIFWKEPY